MQQLFDFDIDELNYESLIHYPGGKHYARKILSEYIPMGTKEIVSPFFGGGSLEFFLTKKGIKVNGYDAFPPLVNFWKVVLKHPKDVYELVNKIILEKDRDYFFEMQTGGFGKITDPIQQAAIFYLLQALSYNSKAFRGKNIKHYVIRDDKVYSASKKAWGCAFDHHRIKEFGNSFVTVDLLDFEQALDKHKHLFAYCDPPYPEVAGMYGDSTKYHEDFDHERLKYVLSNRNTLWVLSYNNCETVKKLYPEDHYSLTFPDWKQGSRKTDRGNEILIKPR